MLGFIPIFQNTCDYIEHETISLANPAQFLNLLSVSQTSKVEKKKWKKKIEISSHFADTDFYKSTIHSRLTVWYSGSFKKLH